MTTKKAPNASRGARSPLCPADQRVETLTVEGRPPRVLLAEDDAGMRVLLREALSLAGCDVVECRDGLELMQRLAGFKGSEKLLEYDLVISDIRMPYTTGMDVLRGIDEYTGQPPIIFVTGFGDDDTRDMAKRLGAAAVLTKPLDLPDLMALVQRCLSSDRRDNYRRETQTWEGQWAAF